MACSTPRKTEQRKSAHQRPGLSGDIFSGSKSDLSVSPRHAACGWLKGWGETVIRVGGHPTDGPHQAGGQARLYVGCGFVINSFCYLEVCSIYAHFGKSFYHERLLNFITCFFSVYWDDLLWFLSFLLLMWCITLIRVCWTILVTLRWIQLDCGVWSFLCVVGFTLLIFCWEFLHLYSSKILACNFLFGWCLCLVLVSGMPLAEEFDTG